MIAYYWITGQVSLDDGSAENEVPIRTAFLRVGRIVTICMGLGILILLFRLGERLGGVGAGLLASGLWSANYLVPYYSQTTNLDIPYIFWVLLALERIVTFHHNGKISVVIASAVFTALAVGTKDQAAAIVLAYPVLLVWSPFPPSTTKLSPQPRSRKHILGVWLLTSLGTYGVLSQAFFRPLNYWNQHVKMILGGALSPFQTKLGYLELITTHFQRSFDLTHPVIYALLIAGTLGLILIAPRLWGWLALPVIFYHGIFLLGSRLFYTRFLLLHFAFFALMAGIGGGRFLQKFPRIADITIPVLAVVFYTTSLPTNWFLWNDPRKNADKWFNEHLEVLESLGTYCPLNFFLPNAAQMYAQKTYPKGGHPSDLGTEYLICVRAWFHLCMTDDHITKEWEDLLAGNRGYKLIAHFKAHPIRFLGANIEGKNLGIPGLAQPVFVLRRSAAQAGEKHL